MKDRYDFSRATRGAVVKNTLIYRQSRHADTNRHPVNNGFDWVPAFAGMTASRRRRINQGFLKTNKERITIRLDLDIIQWFREQVKSGAHQSLINDARRAHNQHHGVTLETTLRRVLREELKGGIVVLWSFLYLQVQQVAKPISVGSASRRRRGPHPSQVSPIVAAG